MFGPLKISYLARFTDLSRTEASILLIFALGVLYFGLATTDIIDPIYNATKWILVQ
jgi:NADH:ubiquinone oxidoreductase subunit 4 (subunit M)